VLPFFQHHDLRFLVSLVFVVFACDIALWSLWDWRPRPSWDGLAAFTDVFELLIVFVFVVVGDAIHSVFEFQEKVWGLGLVGEA
jgi:NADH:ubiquinone oxidoreductase subunit 3 (subunit A)